MPDFDLIIRSGTLASLTDVCADIAVADEKIVALEENISGTTREEIDATGLHIFPGLIDSHVHFNDPGRADWEGFATGSRALAAGGGTLFFDMPLNAHPPTIDAESFDQKLAAAKQSSLTDFAFWGGIVPHNLDKLEELSGRGVIGFKAFMSNSGIDDFPCVDLNTLREGMKHATKLGKIVAVHAEDETITRELSLQKIVNGKTGVRDYLQSRPIAAELRAIHNAIELAGETGCALHIVHVSSAAGVELVAEAIEENVNVTCETCPHYLSLTDLDMEKLGAVAKCAPPLRSEFEQHKLWEQLLAGSISTVGSDHSPAPPEMKTGSDFFKAWGGISGIQHTLPLLLSHSPEVSLITRLTSLNVAERFRLPCEKGRIEAGSDADLALVDLRQTTLVKCEDLFYRHKQSPYVGRELRGKVLRTILRGQTIFHNGNIVAKPSGRLLKPQP